jgi:hypothetical protein
MSIASLLETILSYTARVNPDLPLYLQSGLSATEVYELAPVPFQLPDEVLDLYAWHNGTREHPTGAWQELFYYHMFLPLEQAFAEYQWRMQFNADEGFEVFDPYLFPLFTFQGEHYLTRGADEQRAQSEVFFDYHGSAQVYDTLHTMLAAIAECYESGAYAIVGDGYELDEVQVAVIKAKWNKCRYRSDGSIVSHHP